MRIPPWRWASINLRPWPPSAEKITSVTCSLVFPATASTVKRSVCTTLTNFENTPLNCSRHGPANSLANWQIKDHVYLLRNNIAAEICWQKVLKFRGKFARIKFMKFLSHVLVMYDCHILFNILCIGSVRNKRNKGFANPFGGFGMYRWYVYVLCRILE